MRIAVLGMGRMGRALAGRVLAGGHELVVWNRSPGKAEELVDAGAAEVDEPLAAAHGADIVLTMLSDDEAVREVVFGPNGARHGLAPDAVLVDCSTVSPEVGAELAREIGRAVTMPVLGNPDAVASGNAVYLVGREAGVVEELGPLLSALGGTVRRYPSAALAATAKLTSNLLLLAGLAALAEGFAVGRAGGLSDESLRELLGQSPLVAPALRNRFEALLTGELDSWWTCALGEKDVRLALAVGSRGGRDLPVGEAVRGVYRAAVEDGQGQEDIAVIGTRYC